VKRLLPLLLLLAAPAAAAPRAVWTWEKDSYELLESTAAAAEAAEFLLSKGINTVYLYADSYGGRCLIESDPRLYRRLIREYRRLGINVYALLGSWHLHTEEYILPGRRAEALAMFRRVLRYNRRALPEEKFAGVNLDIEPHLLDAWPEKKQELLLAFLDLGAEFMRLKRESGLQLKVGPAMPFWWDNIPLSWRGRLRMTSEHAQELFDYVALMAYRDRAAGRDGIISHSLAELRFAAAAGRKVAVGVETIPNELKKVTFNHLAEEDLERELAVAAAAFRDEPAFAGFVIHHYSGYRRWLESQKKK
jgi:hypothetical protein